jgi:membrane protein
MTALWRHFPYLLRRTTLSSIDDELFRIAKGAAYSAILSFLPALTSVAAVLVKTRAEFVSKFLTNFLSDVLPPGTEQLVLPTFSLKGSRPLILLVIAALLSLWAASSVVKSLMEGFHAAYRTPRSRPFVRETGVAIMLVLICVLPIVAASAMILFGQQVEGALLGALRLDPMLNPIAPVWEWLSRIARYLVAFVATVTMTAILYYFGPNRQQRWARVWPGAVLSTVLWLLTTAGFGFYVRNVTNYSRLYGSVGAVMALLLWMYLIAAIALIGCEFNAEYERMLSHEPK